MDGLDSCFVVGWLLPIVFSFAIPVGVAHVAEGGGCFACAWEPSFSLNCTEIFAEVVA